MTTTRNILVPVDFSENAFVAVRYAAGICAHYGFRLRLLHAYLPFRSAFQTEAMNQADLDLSTKEKQVAMNLFVNKTLEATGMPAEGLIRTGILTEVVMEDCAMNKPSMIVMGTKGATGLKYVLMGSNTFDVSRITPVPLLIVPENTVHFDLQRAGVLTDFQPEDRFSLEALDSLFGAEPEIRMLHISDKEAIPEENVLALQQHTAQYHSFAGKGKLDYKHVWYGIGMEHIIRAEGIDLLVLTVKDRSFFDRLLHKSFSKAVIHNACVPILFVRSPL